MSEPRMTKEIVFNEKVNWAFTSFDKMFSLLEEIHNKIPAEELVDAKVSLISSGIGEYKLLVSYKRLETPEEVEVRDNIVTESEEHKKAIAVAKLIRMALENPDVVTINPDALKDFKSKNDKKT